ncbi:MAG TPA: hypothetical protein VNS58_26230 [Puia sp.]|nr:hypothetical protein [Puia sp.]
MQKYKSFGIRNFRNIPQVQARLSEEEKKEIEVIGAVLPFRTNNFIVDELIDWDNIPNDPMFQLTFPQKGMLIPEHFKQVSALLWNYGSEKDVRYTVNNIREQLNPHPSGQMDYNVPFLDGQEVKGLQHKYEDTVLFFPSQAQTCHAYCTYCFRWPQFIGNEELKFQTGEIDLLIRYLKRHPEVTDVLITGGDPMIMNVERLKQYIIPLLDSSVLPNLQTIRIGTKSLSYWPYKYTTDIESDDLMRLFETVVNANKNLAIMAHINHPVELRPGAVQEAIRRILRTGAQIRTQAPVMNHINNSSKIWKDLWNEQVRLGCVPYYMFIARDTGAQNYFAVPLIDALRIFSKSYQDISGLARTARGPCMSTTPGKIQILGAADEGGESLLMLKFLRARRKEWTDKIFFAKYDDQSIWLDDLTPASGFEHFFYEKDYSETLLNNR